MNILNLYSMNYGLMAVEFSLIRVIEIQS
jgi:hypothetical protein